MDMLAKIVQDFALVLYDTYFNLPYRWRAYIRCALDCMVLIFFIFVDFLAAWFIINSNHGVTSKSFMKICFLIYNLGLWLLCLLYTVKFNREYCYYQYQLDHSPVPPNIYQLNFHYNNIYECALCLDPFNPITFGNESILHCGHRYHTKCIGDWEWDVLKSSYNPWIKLPTCPMCRGMYTWQQKWNYMYTIQ